MFAPVVEAMGSFDVLMSLFQLCCTQLVRIFNSLPLRPFRKTMFCVNLQSLFTIALCHAASRQWRGSVLHCPVHLPLTATWVVRRNNSIPNLFCFQFQDISLPRHSQKRRRTAVVGLVAASRERPIKRYLATTSIQY